MLHQILLIKNSAQYRSKWGRLQWSQSEWLPHHNYLTVQYKMPQNCWHLPFLREGEKMILLAHWNINKVFPSLSFLPSENKNKNFLQCSSSIRQSCRAHRIIISQTSLLSFFYALNLSKWYLSSHCGPKQCIHNSATGTISNASMTFASWYWFEMDRLLYSHRDRVPLPPQSNHLIWWNAFKISHGYGRDTGLDLTRQYIFTQNLEAQSCLSTPLSTGTCT